MCKSGEMGRRQCLGGRKGRGMKDTRRLNPNEGAFLRTESACVSPADGLLSVESWGVGAKSFPCAQGGLFFYPILHLSVSPQPLPLLHSVLFAVVLCLTVYLTFVNFFFFLLLLSSSPSSSWGWGSFFPLHGLFCVL